MNRFKAAWDLLTRANIMGGNARDVNPNLYGANNLFGSIANNKFPFQTKMDFIPVDSNKGILELNSNEVSASWVGLSSRNMQYWAYVYCSPLAAVIDRLAEADTNGRIEFVNDDNTTRKPELINKNPKLLRIQRLFKKPNPWQTWEEFNSEQLVLCKIFGYCPVFAVGGSRIDRSTTSHLFNLNPYFTTPEYSDYYSVYDVESNDIKHWNITIGSDTIEIPSEDVIFVKDGYINDPITRLPISKVAGLDYFVSNICAAMEADNVLLKKKGPLGVFSHDPKPDMAGWMPMDPGQKDDLQDDLKKYGLTLGQLQYVISRHPIKWNAMSFNLRDLMTKETVRQGIDGICDRLGYPAELMSGKNATYENRNSAEKYLYQNNIIPFSLRRMARYNQFFGLEGVRLVLDYDHLPVLQEDIVHAGQARLALSQSLEIDWLAGIITYNDYRIKLDMDTVPGMDIFYNEYIKKYPPPEPKATKPATKPLKKAA